MKALIIGGNRFVGLRLSHAWDQDPSVDLHIVNRTGQAAHTKNSAVYKSDRNNLSSSHLDKDWDVIVDFACFTQAEAEKSLDYFKKVGRYIFISTVSVYDSGDKLVEKDFDPQGLNLQTNPSPPADPGLAYQFGKQRAEAIFQQRASFPSLLVRLPFIVGLDDYTERLAFHVRRVESQQPIWGPNLECRFSLIHSPDAAKFLSWAATQTFTGPINVASPDSISLRELLGQVSDVVGRKAMLIDTATIDNSSPYGMRQNKAVNTAQLSGLGFKIPETKAWLKNLISDLSSNPKSSRLH